MDKDGSYSMHLLIDLQACQSLVHGTRGIGKFARSLVRALARQANGRRISYLINGDLEESAIELRRELLASVDSRDIHVWSAPTPRNAGAEGNDWRIAAARLVRDAVISSIAPDCPLFMSFFEGWADNCDCTLPSTDTGVATAVVVHDLIPFIYPDIYLPDARLRDWYLALVKRLGGADILLAVSDSSRREVLDAVEYAPERVLSISEAVDEHYVPTAVPEGVEQNLRARLNLRKPFVMYTGGIDHRKNIDLLIEAFANTGPFARSHQLAIVCAVHSEEAERLRALAKRVGLAKDALILTNFVSDNDLLTLYSLCELFVFPSWHEGFGLPVLEAMSVGAPVIAASTSSLPEVVGENGEFFDPRNKQSISDAIIRVLSDSALRARLASDGLARSKLFTWERTAAEAWRGIELAASGRTSGSAQAASSREIKPKLAFLSPLPPQRSGIADFSVELLPELMAHYEIELIVGDPNTQSDLGGLALPVRGTDWFLANAKRFDRVLYHFGNSEFHSYMFEVLAKIPGTVVLHDFYLGNLHHFLQDTGRVPGFWQRALYEGHGYHALKMLGETADRNVTAFKFPCNWEVINGADGVIVHSAYSRGLAGNWYGKEQEARFIEVPLLRKSQDSIDRAAARRSLGLDDAQIVVATFGMLSASKCNDTLLDAWLAGFADRTDCQLVFVGQAANPDWERMLKDRAKAAGARNVLITGFADPATYRQWLASTDVAVQLRCQSRGETSAAVLDCFAWGLPTIVNGHGSLAELPPESAAILEDKFTVSELTNAVGTLIESSEARSALGRAGKQYLQRAHNPVRVAQQYFQTIEAFHKRSSRRVLEGAVDKLNCLDVGRAPTDGDCDAAALGLSALLGSLSPQAQLLLDVSELVRTDARSGIQRVVRSVLQELLSRTDLNWRVEPVYTTGDGTYRYARKFTCEFLACPDTTLDDDLIDVGAGDVFIGLDLAPTGVPAATGLFESLKARGVKLVFVLYDMLPLAHPEWFPPNASDILSPWYRAVASVADRVVAISRSVADDFATWLPSTGRQVPLELSWFHLGADVHASVPSRGMSVEDELRLKKLIKKGNMVLMVGTIEPRKGHDQALEAFATLRARGVDAELVIVGKQGWCVEELIERLRSKTASGSGVTWFSSASDELLDQLYGSADLLLVASRGEGFGLPIVEAAMRGVTVLARDIPVFREVGGQGIVYFSGDTADDLANAIERTLAVVHSGQQPDQASIAVSSWAVSAGRFLDASIGKMSYRTWCSV